MFCRYCGNPSETPVCPTCAAAQAQDAQPVVAPEETQVVTPEVTQPVMPEPVAVAQPVDVQPVAPEYPQPMQIAQPEYAQPDPPKKKSKKGLWISLVAVVAAVGVAVFAFWPTLSHLFQSPEDYLKDVTTDSLSSYTDSIANLYGTLIKGEPLSDDYNTASTKVSLELNDGLAGMLATALQSEGINLTADKLKSISVSCSVTMEDDLIQVNANVGLSGQEALGITAAVDMQNSVAYLSVPRLSQQALKLDLKQAFGIDLANLNLLGLFATGSWSQSYATFTSLQDALPSEDAFQTMLDGYLEAALEQITQVEKTSEDVTVDGHTQNQTALVATIDEATTWKIGKAVLQHAQNDETLKEILLSVENAIATNYGQSLGLYNQLMAELPELIAEMDQEILTTQANPNNSLQFKLYVDGDDVLGYQVAAQGMTLFAMNNVEVNGTHYFQLTAPATGMVAPLFSGSYTESGDTKTGEITMTVEGISFMLGFECSDTSVSLRFTPPAALLQEALGINAAYLADGISLNWTTAVDDTSVSLPENTVDANNETQVMTWAYSLIGNLPSLLSDLGVPQDVLSDLFVF